MGLAVGVVSGANESCEAVEEMQGGERSLDGFAGAARDYGEGDTAVLGFDVFQNLWDWLELGKELEVEGFFAARDRFDGHVEAVTSVEGGDDFGDGLAAPFVEQRFIEGAVPFG